MSRSLLQEFGRFAGVGTIGFVVDGGLLALLISSGVNPYLLRAHCIGVKIPEDVSLAGLRSLLDHEDYNNG